MSLSRPVNFPLLKLPWLCVKRVIHISDVFDIIYFATISKRARRIVKSSSYPLKEIDVYPNNRGICMGNGRTWHFNHDKYRYGAPLVLQKDSQPCMPSKCFDSNRGYNLHSYTDVDTLDALKMGMDFLIDVFGCSVREVFVSGNKLSDLFRLGISSVQVLFITKSAAVNRVNLKYLLETIKVTDKYAFYAPISENFSCDPQIFKCRSLSFGCKKSADWVTLDLLCQLDVSIMTFAYHRFSIEDIVSYITHWFNSESRTLEYVKFGFNNSISLENFKIEHLNPMPFCKKRRNRYPLNVGAMDMSRGKDILRQDGLLATLHAFSTTMIFYVWHQRFPDDVQQ